MSTHSDVDTPGGEHADRRRPEQIYVSTDDYQGPSRRQAGQRLRGALLTRQWFGFGGQRTLPGRRPQDWEQPFVDRYPPPLLLPAVGVMVLAIVEAWLQLQLWPSGSSPGLVGALVQPAGADILVQIRLKLALTATAVLIMVIYSHFTIYRRLRVGHCLYLLCAAYALLAGNQWLFWLRLRDAAGV